MFQPWLCPFWTVGAEARRLTKIIGILAVCEANATAGAASLAAILEATCARERHPLPVGRRDPRNASLRHQCSRRERVASFVWRCEPRTDPDQPDATEPKVARDQTRKGAAAELAIGLEQR